MEQGSGLSVVGRGKSIFFDAGRADVVLPVVIARNGGPIGIVNREHGISERVI